MARIVKLIATPKGFRRVSLTSPWLPRSARTPCLHEPQLHALARTIENTCPPPSARAMSSNLRTALKRWHAHHLVQE
ncbi:hypothetical protein [Methylobacterium oxalidis]|nr:hypothetical protein [Methylobacterium oxalidis]